MSINVTRVTNSESLRKVKPILCHRCKQQVSPIATIGVDGNPICPGCAGARARVMVQPELAPEQP